jgi:hypothetical protein
MQMTPPRYQIVEHKDVIIRLDQQTGAMEQSC